MNKEKNRNYVQYVFTLLIILSLFVVPAETLFAQEDLSPADNDAVPELVTDLYENPNEPYIYMDEISRIMRQRDISKLAPEVAEVAAADTEFADSPNIPSFYMDDIARIMQQRDASKTAQDSATGQARVEALTADELHADLMRDPYYPHIYMEEIGCLLEQRDGESGK